MGSFLGTILADINQRRRPLQRPYEYMIAVLKCAREMHETFIVCDWKPDNQKLLGTFTRNSEMKNYEVHFFQDSGTMKTMDDGCKNDTVHKRT